LDHRAHGYREHESARQTERATEGLDAHRVTPRELMDRMRERTRSDSGSIPANAADGGNR
jgi:hypothetical protein